MKNPHIVAFSASGHGIGKTTLADAFTDLLRERNHSVKRYSFADPLRRAVDAVLVPAYPDIDWLKAKTFKNARLFDNFSYRDILIYIANSFRHINDNIFVNAAETVYAEAKKACCSFFIIDDLRFPQELIWAKSKPSTTIYLTNKGFIPHPYPSENLISPTSFDIILERGMETPDELAQYIISYLEEKELTHEQ